jgi:hypothetical protein
MESGRYDGANRNDYFQGVSVALGDGSIRPLVMAGLCPGHLAR